MASSESLGRGTLEKALAEIQKTLSEKTVQKEQLLTQLNNAQTELKRSNSELNKQNREVDYERLRSLVFAARSVNTAGHRIDLVAHRLPELEKRLTTPNVPDQVKARIKDGIAAIKATLRDQEGETLELFGLYIDSVLKTAKVSEEDFKADLRRLRQEIERAGVKSYDRYVETAQRHIVDARTLRGSIPAARRAAWLAEIDETREKRPSAK